MASQLKIQDLDPGSRLSTLDITQLIFPDSVQAGRKTLQNLHTHAVDSAIQILGNNRVLKERPPPIADEEQKLNRRQRCTLSQLRSGHCHLLQDKKHRVFANRSDICTDCGASPQYVIHTRRTCHLRIYGGSGGIDSRVQLPRRKDP